MPSQLETDIIAANLQGESLLKIMQTEAHWRSNQDDELVIKDESGDELVEDQDIIDQYQEEACQAHAKGVEASLEYLLESLDETDIRQQLYI